MAKYLVEVPHGEEEIHCARVVQVFLESGSHYLTNADWGCDDGEHKAWLIVDVESKEEALSIVPPAFRSEARIVMTRKFTKEDIEDVLQQKEG
jgi:hypothetical protein